MATDQIEDRRGAFGIIFGQDDMHWQHFQGRAYECRVLLCPEAGGGYSAHALRLPGVVSEGETVDEALKNIADAFQASLESYLEQNVSIPWCENAIERRTGCLERWIVVNV